MEKKSIFLEKNKKIFLTRASALYFVVALVSWIADYFLNLEIAKNFPMDMVVTVVATFEALMPTALGILSGNKVILQDGVNPENSLDVRLRKNIAQHYIYSFITFLCVMIFFIIYKSIPCSSSVFFIFIYFLIICIHNTSKALWYLAIYIETKIIRNF